MPQKLDPEAVKQSLAALPHWRMEEGGDAIMREFRFRDFTAAMDFMQSVAHEADAMNHHPEWKNIYNRVQVRLTTHSCKGLTALDFGLAAAMEKHAAQKGAK